MTTSLDAVCVSDRVRETYLRYLRTLLPVRDVALRDSLHEALADRAGLVKGPILEATPPYATGASVGELMDQGVLPRWFHKLDHPDGLPLDRPLYQHQEDAVRKAATGRNLVVATGTGSGKTESFLLPILSSLAQEQEAGTLDRPGVRALLLYPMNALANDQLKRLRELLRPTPEITFGRYTGETLADPGKARDRFARQHPGVEPPPNEILSREEMQERPPHLLLTNYAMLEYLLLRPRDTTLFDGPTGEHWRFIVMDEAHVYDGASGIEVAMLLRRLQDRVASGSAFQAIATSATVGGERSGPEVAGFASTLLGLPFQYDEARPEHQDVVWATRVAVDEVRDTWGPLPAESYATLLSATPKQQMDLVGAHTRIDENADLATILANEQRVHTLRQRLAAGPEQLPEVARALFPEHEDAVTLTGQLVALGAAVRDRMGAPLLPARYHLWARATEGAFSCLSEEGPHVRLARHVVCEACRAAVFEFGSCKRCAATYLIGTKQRDGDREVLTPPREVGKPLAWFVLLGDDEVAIDPEAVLDEDEATLESLEDLEDHEERTLCTRCGTLGERELSCRCGAPTRRLLEVQKSVAKLQSCGLCGGRSNAGQIRRLESGVDASVSVLSTALYQELPPDPNPELAEKPGGGRKLLFFADSRQDAAYFAPYLADSYDQLVRRRVVYDAVRKIYDPDDPARLDDVADRAVKVATGYGLFEWRASRREKLARSSAWTHAELLSIGTMTSLEGLGLIAFDLLRPPDVHVPPPLLALGLDESSAWALIRELLRTVRGQGAVTFPDNVAADDQIFEPRLGPIYLRGEGSEAKRKVLSWLPTRGVNTRIDYLRRVLAATSSDADATELARGIWRWLNQGPAGELLRQFSDPTRGVVTQLDHELVTVRLVSAQEPVHRCSRCQRVAPLSVLDVCPTLRCSGVLELWSPPTEATDDDHYRAIARTLNAVPLSISEHTAQFRSDEAAEIQQRFLDGELNALSCSTTFELGVDVGELQSVLLRNVPPTTANYVQRAGRAGRRTDSAALVVTYAQRRSHDLAHFRDPTRMISGVVRSPRVTIDNDRIARRHAHAIALAAYFRHAASEDVEFKEVVDLFGDDRHDEQLIGWLREVPAGVVAAIARSLPDAVLDRVGVHDGAWVDHLVQLLEDLATEHRTDVEAYRELEREAGAQGRYQLAQMYQRVIRTLERRQLISHLSAHNVLPKYGFPVDTVELRTNHIGTPEAQRIELTRDLKQAISDYAPGSQLVAGGLLWESAGIYRFPDRELPKRHYASCSCGWYEQSLAPIEVTACPSCGKTGRQAPTSRIYLQPEFGFVAARTTPRRPTTRPLRTYSGTVHLVDASLDGEAETLRIGDGALLEHRYAERGELAVINEGLHGRGYRICRWCGAGRQAQSGQHSTVNHEHPQTGRECRGSSDWVSLGHVFETDVLEVRFGSSVPAVADVWWGLLYAVVEAAAEQLMISRDDIDGTLHLRTEGPPTLILFDDVPAGAGHVRRVREQLHEVLEAALRRVADCECGEQTSCYRCLRGFRNQRMHERLRRGAVAELLSSLLGRPSPPRSSDDEAWSDATVHNFEAYDGENVRVQSTTNGVTELLEGKLWVEAHGGDVTTLMLVLAADGDVRYLEPENCLVVAVGGT